MACSNECVLSVSPSFVFASSPLPFCFLYGNLQCPPNFLWPPLCFPFTAIAPSPLDSILSPPSFHPSTPPPPFHYQISACVSGLNTWNMSQRSVMASHQTSSTPWSDSLSCSVKPTRCSAPETWDLSSATSSSQTWTTWRPSGPTTWMEICWKPSSWSSSATPWGWQQGRRGFACWSVWTRMTMRKAEGCFGLLAVGEERRNLVRGTTDRLTGLFKQIPSGVRCKLRRMKW